MQTRRMGRTGLRVSEVCLGTMTFGNQADEQTSFGIMDAADEAGVYFFDTADAYPLGGEPGSQGRTEEIVGKWLEDRGARHRVILATKCFGTMSDLPNDRGLSRKHIIEACDASLRRLRTDYIDLYQAHQFDADTPIEETMRAFDTLVQAGKVRYAGCSNYPAWRLGEALWTSERGNLARYECVQPRYNILFRMIEDELLPLCREHGVGVIAYNPLAGGMLTGRYRTEREVRQGTRFGLSGAGEMYQKRYWNDAVFQQVERLGDYFEARGKSLAHVALAWVLAQEGITSAILGASVPEQLRESLGGVGLALDEEEMKMCDEAWYNLPKERDPSIARR